MQFRMAAVTKEYALLGLGNQLFPRPQALVTDRELLGRGVTMVQIVRCGTVTIIAANLATPAQQFHQFALAEAACLALIPPEFGPLRLGGRLLPGFRGR